MKNKLYVGIISMIAVGSLVSGCAKKMAKKDILTPTEEITSQPTQEEEKEASIRGKEYAKIPELATIHFELDKYELTPQARAALSRNSEWLKANPDAEINIEGHCDERGTTEYNLALGVRRAKTVQDYYQQLGIPKGRTSSVSYGEEKSLCSESTESCWMTNRRAETLARVPSRS